MGYFLHDTSYTQIKSNIYDLENNSQLFLNKELKNDLHIYFIHYINYINTLLLSEKYYYVKKSTIYELLDIMMFYFSNFMKNKTINDNGWGSTLFEHIELIESVFSGALEIQENHFPEVCA